jgi:hypothetical protein
MTEERLPLAELLAKAGDGDFLRSVAEAVVQLLMETDVDGLIGGLADDLDGDAGRVCPALGGMAESAKARSTNGKLRREALSSGTAPSRSWTEAGWTWSISGLPSVSAIAWLLRPSTFLPAS